MKKLYVYKIYAKRDFDENFLKRVKVFKHIRAGMPLPALLFMELRCNSRYYQHKA